MAKTLWHGELTKAGPVTVQVTSDLKASRYPGKPNYVYLKVLDKAAGQWTEERPYNVENATCEAFFKGQKGRTFVIVAEGKEATATITYVGEAAAGVTPAAPTAPPPPPAHPPTAAAPPAPPAAAGPGPASYVPPRAPAPPPPPPASSMTREHALKATKAFVGQRLALRKVCLKAVLSLKREWDALPEVKEAKLEMPVDEVFQMATSLYISAESQGLAIRSGFADAMPTNVDLATLTPPKKVSAPSALEQTMGAPAPAPLVECPKCREKFASLMQSGMCAKCDEAGDDVPF